MNIREFLLNLNHTSSLLYFYTCLFPEEEAVNLSSIPDDYKHYIKMTLTALF